MLYFLRRGGQCRSRSAIVVRGLELACDGRETNRFDDKLLQYTSDLIVCVHSLKNKSALKNCTK
jgi:hypothetical protein